MIPWNNRCSPKSLYVPWGLRVVLKVQSFSHNTKVGGSKNRLRSFRDLGQLWTFEFTNVPLRPKRPLSQFPMISICSLVNRKLPILVFCWVAVGITALLMYLDVVAVDLLWIGGAKFVAKRHFGMSQVVRGMQVCCFFQCCADK